MELQKKYYTCKVDEIKLKGENNKNWQVFCQEFKDVEDYNYGTMLRMKADGIYDEANTIITTRIIFLAIEGARNVEGINEKCKEQYKALYQQNAEMEATNSSSNPSPMR
jgi:hypothetical protein